MAIPRRPTIRASTAQWLAAAIGVIFLGIAAWAIYALTRGEDAAPGPAVSLQEIDADPEAYLGQTVTVTDTVQEIVRPGVFTMGETRLVVIQVTGIPDAKGDLEGPPAAENEMVQVTGTVRMFDLTELEREHGWDFSDEPVWQFADNRPTIIAREVSRVPDENEITGTQ